MRRHMDPWRKRRHPHRYDPDTLHATLLDDYVHNRPLGGPDERGVAFLLGACQKVAAQRGTTPEDYFQSLCAEGASLTGRSTVPLG